MTDRDDTSVLQDDLADLLKALGLPSNAQARSPHDIFREAIDEVKRLKASNGKPEMMPPWYYQGCQYGEPEPVFSLRHPDCPICKGIIGNFSCANCAPEFMAAGQATPDDVREAAQKWAKTQRKEAAIFEANWPSDPKLIHMVGSVVRYRRHTPRASSSTPSDEA